MKKHLTMSAIVLLLVSMLAVGVSATHGFNIDTTPAVPVSLAEGQTLDIAVAFNDATGSVSGYDYDVPAFVDVTQHSSTSATLSVAPGFTDAGSYSVVIEATDDMGTPGDDTDDEDATLLFTLTVNPATPSSSLLVVSDVALGSARQVRSNPEADDAEDQDVFVTGSFTIRNDGPDSITGIAVIKSALLGSESDYSLTGVPSSLAPGASATVGIEARVHKELDAVDEDAKKVAPLVAQLTVTGNMAGTTLSQTRDVTMEAENQLEIKKLNVCVNGSCDTVRDGDKVEDLKPGDRIDVTFRVENKYKDNDAENLEILDVTAFILVEEGEFDVDEDDDIGDMGPDEEEEVTLSFDVEDDAEDRTVTMLAWVEGEDENGARHGELFEIELEVKRERHEVSLRDVRLEPDTLSCNEGGDQTVVLSLELQNTGRDDEDEAAVEIENSDLGISKVERDIVIDQDDRDRKSYTLRVPSGARSGLYALSVKSFTRRDDLSDSDDVILTVPTCAAPVAPEMPDPEPAEDAEDEEVVVVTGPAPDTTSAVPALTGAVAAPVTSSSGKVTNNGMYVALLVAIIVVLVIIGVMLVNALAKRN